MKFSTPLRYPGGKGKLTEFIKLLFLNNNIIGGEYIEPYAGGSGIALNLLMDGYASTIHLNDLNPSVYAFWHSVVNEPDLFCKMIFDTPITMDEWYKQKNIQNNQTEHTKLELGFSTFFLNRTNRSGILLAGVIGGKEQKGKWKIDARFNKDDLINRIEKIALNQNKIKIYNLDAAKLITETLPAISQNSLIYLDPPYYVKGKGLYENHYLHEDHVAIAKLVKNNIKHKWVVSYDYTPEIIKMYKECNSINYGINYSAQNRYSGAEVMFFSKDLIIPDIKNPANLSAA